MRVKFLMLFYLLPDDELDLELLPDELEREDELELELELPELLLEEELEGE